MGRENNIDSIKITINNLPYWQGEKHRVYQGIDSRLTLGRENNIDSIKVTIDDLYFALKLIDSLIDLLVDAWAVLH